MTPPERDDAAGREQVVRAADGTGLSVREWGDPDGTEIVLIHGVAQCHLCFARQTDGPLARRHRIVAFDLRGHGGSDKPLDPRRYADGRVWADDVAAVIAAKKLRRPVLVGWSLGGRVLRQYLMHHGDAGLGGVNFLASRPIEDPSVTGPGSHAVARSRALDFPARLRAEIGFLRDCFATPPDAAEFALAVAYNMVVPREVRDAIADWSTDPEEARTALGRVRVPVLVTHGRLDRLILPEAAAMTAAAIPGARLSWFEASGHSPFYEEAGRYNDELDRFVSECRDAPAGRPPG